MRTTLFVLAATLLVAGCGSDPAANSPRSYTVLITEPSGNVRDGHGQILGHWSCGLSGSDRNDLVGVEGATALRASMTCPPKSLLTIETDGAIRAYPNPTRLRCEVFTADGQRIATEEAERSNGYGPTCRVPVP